MPPVPVITLPKTTQAEHYVIHSDTGTPTVSVAGLQRQRRRDTLNRRKPSPTCEGLAKLKSSEAQESSETLELEPAAASAECESVRASPTSQLRRENDVLRMQVQTLREVQEQTAEIHWQVISNIVAERNLYESRWREATDRAEVAEAQATRTTTAANPVAASRAPSVTEAMPPAPRLSLPARVYTLTPSLCRR
ncbi:unnamed protein product, partial [Symbiodinium pilosum]